MSKIKEIDLMSKIIQVDLNNFHSSVRFFCSENNIDICDNNIIDEMILKGYSFICIPPSRIKRGLAELRYKMTNGDHTESLQIIRDKCPYCENKEQLEIEEEEELNLNNSSDSE